MSEKHKHYWNYLHSVWQGRYERTNEVGVVRYCACGLTQMAFASKWQKPPETYDLNIPELKPARKP